MTDAPFKEHGKMKRLISMMLIAITAIGTAMPLVASGNQNSDGEEFHQRYDLTPGAIVSVRNISGRITIKGWRNNYADVYAIKRSRRGSADELSRVHIDVTNSPSRLDIRTTYDRGRGNVEVEYTISVPMSVNLDSAHSTSGDVSVTEISGYAIAGSTSGAIEVRDIGDYAKAESTSGDIEVSGIKGNITASSTSGNVHVRDGGASRIGSNSGDLTISNINGSADIHTHSGEVSAGQIRGNFTAGTSSGNIRADDVTGNVRLESISGEVTAQKVTGSIIATSVSGKVEVTGGNDLIEVRSTSDDVIVTGAKGRIEATSTSGNVRLVDIQSSDVQASSTSSDVQYSGSLNSGGSYSFDSLSGNVRMVFPPDNCGFTLSAKTFSGNIDSDFPINITQMRQNGTDRRIEGTVG